MPMSYPDVLAKVICIVANNYSVDPADLTPDTELVGDLNSNSLDMISFIIDIEAEFLMKITDTDRATYCKGTIGGVSTYLFKRMSEND